MRTENDTQTAISRSGRKSARAQPHTRDQLRATLVCQPFFLGATKTAVYLIPSLLRPAPLPTHHTFLCSSAMSSAVYYHTPAPILPPLASFGQHSHAETPDQHTLHQLPPLVALPPQDQMDIRRLTAAGPPRASTLSGGATSPVLPIAPAGPYTMAGSVLPTPLLPPILLLNVVAPAFQPVGGVPHMHMPILVLPLPAFPQRSQLTSSAGLLHDQPALQLAVMPKIGRPGLPKLLRKKRQCPLCKQFFSNLATHKSTHLKPGLRPHVCDICHRGFLRLNDLARHVKRHWKETGSTAGAFQCPFATFQQLQAHLPQPQTEGQLLGDEELELLHLCHPTGVFSRCDTFKNHLKALHFEYPVGTKKHERRYVGGRCKSCHRHFATVDVWMQSHVETGECEFTLV